MCLERDGMRLEIVVFTEFAQTAQNIQVSGIGLKQGVTGALQMRMGRLDGRVCAETGL